MLVLLICLTNLGLNRQNNNNTYLRTFDDTSIQNMRPKMRVGRLKTANGYLAETS